MNVYYVNRHSRIKGPFDISGSNREQIIKVGDICLRDTINGICFLLVHSSQNTWKLCKLIGVGNNESFCDLGNTLLFSFDGIKKRRGDISLMKELVNRFREKSIIDFFHNAIDILEYKRDFWEVKVFQQLLEPTQLLTTHQEDVFDNRNSNSGNSSHYFTNYLNDDLLNLLNISLANGCGLKESYFILRKREPVAFRSALLKFLADNPKGNIYGRSLNQDPLTSDNNSSQYSNKCVSQNITYNANKSVVGFSVVKKTNLDEADPFSQPYLFSEFTNNEIIDLFKRYYNGDEMAYNLLIKGNLKLVSHLARLFLNKGVSYDDLVQEGSMGLLKAIKYYNYKRGGNFASFATYAIYHSIRQSINVIAYHVKVPERHCSIHRKIKKYSDEYEQKNGFEPSFEDIEINEDVSSDILKPIYNLPHDLSDMTILADDFEKIEDEEFVADKQLIIDSERFEILRLVYSLPKRERIILLSSFGLNGKAPQTLEEIGELYGLTSERVRQIKEKSIRQLRYFLLKIKDKESENKASVEVIETRWKKLQMSQFDNFFS